MLTSLAPARRRLVLGLGGVALVGVVVLVLVVATGEAKHGAVAQDRPGPVLLVPGYGGSTASLEPLAARLRSAGKDVEVVTLPGNALGDLDQQAVALGRAVTVALGRTHASSVDVVGYSAGGVVTRLWVRDHGGAALARRVVTLGSPHHGTQLASLGALVPDACPPACQQLATDSPTLSALNAGDETPAGPAYVSIWTTHDDVVVPPDSARLEGATDLTVQSLCPSDAVDHGGLPRDAVVQRVVLGALATTVTMPTAGC